MSTAADGKPLRKITCRGCGDTFYDHRRSVVYCWPLCGVLSRPLRGLWCFLCNERFEWRLNDEEEGRAEPWLTLIPEDQQVAVFQDRHQACLVTYVHEHRDRDLTACRCVRCAPRQASAAKPLAAKPSGTSRKPAKPRAKPYRYRRFRDEVLERDGWICQLCGLPIPKDLQSGDELSATLDHFIPTGWSSNREVLADDLASTADDVRAAHRFCNALRRDEFSYPPDWVKERAVWQLSPRLQQLGYLAAPDTPAAPDG